MDAFIVAFSLFIAITIGYWRGYREKQEREWLNGYRDGLKDAGFDIKAIIEKYSEK